MVFVQDNPSCSVKGVIRGLHFQKTYPQEKLIRGTRGHIFDVVVAGSSGYTMADGTPLIFSDRDLGWPTLADIVSAGSGETNCI